MLALFRSFRGAGLVAVVAFALGLRSFAWHVGAGPLAGLPDLALGPWGQSLRGLAPGFGGAWALGALAVAFVGAAASYSLQHYRLGAVGAVPGFVAVAFGSAAWWWVGGHVALLGTLAVAAGAHRLFAGYRRQGSALPVYDCGLALGAAWLIAPAFVWFAAWGLLAVAQLRKARLADLAGLLVGVATLPFITGVAAFVWGDFGAFRQNLFAGCIALPSAGELAGVYAWVALLALLTGAAIGAFGQLTTRRPIQEQRAARMWYTLLGVGWVALALGGLHTPWAIALVLYPLALLVGWWLGELQRRRADLVALLVLMIIVGGYLWRAIG